MIREKQESRIVGLMNEGFTVREVAKMEQVSTSTVMRIRKQYGLEDTRATSTQRQEQVIRMYEAGHSMRGIARTLKMGDKTVAKIIGALSNN